MCEEIDIRPRVTGNVDTCLAYPAGGSEAAADDTVRG